MLSIAAIYAFVISLCFGSFLNVVIHRLPRMGYGSKEKQPYNLNSPASHCPHCQHKIRWYENIPVISWLVLRGKCSSCNTNIHWRYPFLELVAGVGGAAIALLLGIKFVTLGAIALWLMTIPLVWWVLDRKTVWSSTMRKYTELVT